MEPSIYLLRFESGKRKGERVPLGPGTTRLGTGRQNDLVLREAGVSFRHATLCVDAAGVVQLEPGESRGGTWIGETQVPPGDRSTLRPGDRFRLGQLELSLAVPPPPRLIALDLGLRFLSGKRQGDHVPLEPGAIPLGSARQAGVSLRQGGISFKHATLRLDELGLGELEDLGSREGTWLNGRTLEPHAPAPIKPWDSLRLGPELQLQLTATLRPVGEAPLRRLLPESLQEELPADLLELAERPERGRWLAQVLDELHTSPGEREGVERDARQMLVELSVLVRAEHLPPRLELWLRQDEETGELSLYHEDSRGLALAWRRWELVARLPSRTPGLDTAQVANALAALFPGAERLVPTESKPAAAGWWHCRYESDRAILGAFERIDAWSDGRVLVAVMRPHFAIRPLDPDRGEDPITELLAEQQSRRLWRPPAMGVGPAAPALPPGGREGRKPLPKRKQ